MSTNRTHDLAILELLEEDVYTRSSSSSLKHCDRRLSRAARTVLHRHLVRTLIPLEEQDSSTSIPDVWTLLDQWLGKAPPTCQLLPVKDVLRHDEEQSKQVKSPTKNLNWAYPTFSLKQRRQSSGNRPKEWCRCGYCGKLFATRYYLDLHLQYAHSHSNSSPDEATMICPATDWCRLVGLANCHQQALEDEPFYDRGSGGWGDDAKFIQHKWTKIAHSIPCDISTVRQDCHQMLQHCQIYNMEEFCDAIQCPAHHYLWHLPDHWQDTWLEEAQHHPGIFGTILVLAILYWITTQTSWISMLYEKTGMIDTSASSPRGKRLLQKSRPGGDKASRPLFGSQRRRHRSIKRD